MNKIAITTQTKRINSFLMLADLGLVLVKISFGGNPLEELFVRNYYSAADSAMHYILCTTPSIIALSCQGDPIAGYPILLLNF